MYAHINVHMHTRSPVPKEQAQQLPPLLLPLQAASLACRVKPSHHLPQLTASCGCWTNGWQRATSPASTHFPKHHSVPLHCHPSWRECNFPKHHSVPIHCHARSSTFLWMLDTLNGCHTSVVGNCDMSDSMPMSHHPSWRECKLQVLDQFVLDQFKEIKAPA